MEMLKKECKFLILDDIIKGLYSPMALDWPPPYIWRVFTSS